MSIDVFAYIQQHLYLLTFARLFCLWIFRQADYALLQMREIEAETKFPLSPRLLIKCFAEPSTQAINGINGGCKRLQTNYFCVSI